MIGKRGLKASKPAKFKPLNIPLNIPNILLRLSFGLIFILVFYRGALMVLAPGIVVETIPANGSKEVPLYREVIIKAGEEIKQASIMVSGMWGDTRVEGNTAVFKPRRVFTPGTKYSVKAWITTENRKDEIEFSFTTMDAGNKIWVEVDLRDINLVTVYRGKKPVRLMLASGGKPGSETETPLGTFYVKDRGEGFFSERFGEGALYWVRFQDQYLFHSVPRDRDGNIIEEEHEKLGIPASHGCIRLRDEDARWFYNNVPYGSMVIIHD